MLLARMRYLLVAWFALVTAIVSVTVATGSPITIGYGMLLFALGVLPPLVVLMVFRGAPARTLSEGLYADEHTRLEVTQRLDRLTRHDDPRV